MGEVARQPSRDDGSGDVFGRIQFGTSINKPKALVNCPVGQHCVDLPDLTGAQRFSCGQGAKNLARKVTQT